MKGTFRPAVHPSAIFRPTPPVAAAEEVKFVDRPCYEFNRQLGPSANDRHCEHCRFYLTAHCPHIDEFLDDVDDLSPE
jgi:hypothetical protein